MPHPLPSLTTLALAASLAACGPRYTPDTYATRAVQQANKVEQGTVIGRRDVRVSAEGSTGAATGAAAGGVLGAQAPGSGIMSALGGVGGALVGGLVGTAAEHTVVDTRAYEYVVRTTGKGELLSVTQKDTTPLAIGQKVLLIAGNQARIVPDYTSEPTVAAARAEPRAAAAPPAPAASAPAESAPSSATAASPSSVAATAFLPPESAALLPIGGAEPTAPR